MTLKPSPLQNLSDRSFITQGSQLIATSIGRTANGTTLSCCLNVENQDYRYCKTEQQILGALLIVEKKLKQWAFRHIQKSTHYHKQKNNAIFLPDALTHGNYGALSKFLGNLRNNRVNSYIKLNMEESKGYFHKATTILKPITTIVHGKLKFVFTRLKKNMIEKQKSIQQNILLDIDKISSIENKDCSFSEPIESPKIKNITVTYVPISLNPQRLNQISHRKSSYTYRQHSLTKKTNSSKNSISTYVDLNDLIEEHKVKVYEFKHITTVKTNREKVSYSRNS